eukprot:gene47530-62564_t
MWLTSDPTRSWEDRIAHVAAHKHNISGACQRSMYADIAPQLPKYRALGLKVVPLIGNAGGIAAQLSAERGGRCGGAMGDGGLGGRKGSGLSALLHGLRQKRREAGDGMGDLAGGAEEEVQRLSYTSTAVRE